MGVISAEISVGEGSVLSRRVVRRLRDRDALLEEDWVLRKGAWISGSMRLDAREAVVELRSSREMVKDAARRWELGMVGDEDGGGEANEPTGAMMASN